MSMVRSLWKTVWQFLKVKRIACDPVNPTPRYMSKAIKTTHPQKNYTQIFKATNA